MRVFTAHYDAIIEEVKRSGTAVANDDEAVKLLLAATVRAVKKTSPARV